MLINVFCIENTDPQYVVVIIAGQLPIQIPKTLYDQIREQFGWPDVICGDS